MQGELIDWAVPVLYARDANRALCAKPEIVSQTPATTVQVGSRRATTGRLKRVAVWDIDDVFPSLDKTIDAMNAAQTVYGFELVDMSVPLDVWDLESEKGKPYLWADKLAHRLQGKPVELRANLLACVTRHWMRDDEWLNLFGWWPQNRKPPVVIFSCAGIENLKPEGRDTDRALANVMVSALVGFFGEMGTHDHGPKNCPMFTNADREVRYMVAEQTFDKSCRQAIGSKMSKELPALEALLKAFR
jgi:hypothetical protein